MQVKKRNGEIEAFDYRKLDNQIKFTFRGYESLIPIFRSEIEEVINNRNEISSDDLLDLYIDTAKNLISRMYPEFANIAGRFYVQKKQKELYGIKHAGEYPIFSETIMSGNIVGIDLEKLDGIRPDVWQELDNMIKPELDFRLTIMGAINMFDKYLFKGELPQLGYMRVALAPFVEELSNKPKEYCADTLALIKQRYNDLTGNTDTGEVAYTEATPKWISSLTKTQQVASCVVMNIADDSESILANTNDAGLYSRYGGGISWYIGFLRSMGSSIDLTGGKSSGIVPFSKLYEATINAFNQRGLRKGSGIAAYDWWGLDIEDFVMLNDKGGVPEKRARGLKLSVVINYLLIERAIKDEQVALFDPKEVGLNYCKTIEEFNKMYETYEKNPHIKKKFVSARDLISLIIKQRKKTGNIYILFKEVVNNETTPFKDTIFTSNLCQEIMLPAQPLAGVDTELNYSFNEQEYTETKTRAVGDTWLCNLASININHFMLLSKFDRLNMVYNLLKAQDNLIDTAFYPNKSGEFTNKMYRPIGIGINNLAKYFARINIKFSSKEAKVEMDKAMREFQLTVIEASTMLAKERGAFPLINNTKWKDENWVRSFVRDERVADLVLERGVRFSTHFAIAPTATSSLIANVTEGIEPIKDFISIKTTDLGATPNPAPDLRQLGNRYELAHTFDNSHLIELAGIRQRYMEQGQSVNTYELAYDKDKSYSIKEETKLWLDCYKNGVKSLYYFNGLKGAEKDECESCSS